MTKSCIASRFSTFCSTRPSRGGSPSGIVNGSMTTIRFARMVEMAVFRAIRSTHDLSGRFTSECRKRQPRLHQRVLSDVFGDGRIAHHRQRHTIDRIAVFEYKGGQVIGIRGLCRRFGGGAHRLSGPLRGFDGPGDQQPSMAAGCREYQHHRSRPYFRRCWVTQSQCAGQEPGKRRREPGPKPDSLLTRPDRPPAPCTKPDAWGPELVANYPGFSSG